MSVHRSISNIIWLPFFLLSVLIASENLSIGNSISVGDKKRILDRIKKVDPINIICSVLYASIYIFEFSKVCSFYSNISKLTFFLLVFFTSYLVGFAMRVFIILLFDFIYTPFLSMSYEYSYLLYLNIAISFYIVGLIISIIIPEMVIKLGLIRTKKCIGCRKLKKRTNKRKRYKLQKSHHKIGCRKLKKRTNKRY